MSNESKEAKFKRLAEKRVNTVLDKIRVLSNLSNTALYAYTNREVSQVFDAVDSAVKNAKASFQRGEKRPRKNFHLTNLFICKRY